MICKPNTKINLGLNVLRKRPDGYHDIETLFVPYFELCDSLEIVAGDDFSRTSARLFGLYGDGGAGLSRVDAGTTVFRVGDAGSASADGSEPGCEKADCESVKSWPKIRQGIAADGKCMITIARAEGVHWDPLSDLCVKAYCLLDSDFGLPPVKIFLEKLAPVGAGLGGGSADAAFTLKMLSEMFGLGLDEARLASYAARLGSDCAFFIGNRPLFGEGRGEILSEFPLPVLNEYDLKVVVPEGIAVSTAEAYRGIVPAEVRRQTARPACETDQNGRATDQTASEVDQSAGEVPLREALLRPVAEWPALIANDFETTVFAAHPELAAIKQSLYDAGAAYASMSGSGSALFALFPKN